MRSLLLIPTGIIRILNIHISNNNKSRQCLEHSLTAPSQWVVLTASSDASLVYDGNIGVRRTLNGFGAMATYWSKIASGKYPPPHLPPSHLVPSLRVTLWEYVDGITLPETKYTVLPAS